MDELVRRFAATRDQDLMLCQSRGIAYQADMSKPVKYDEEYFDKYVSYEGSSIARKINDARAALVDKHAGSDRAVLDVGIGSGEFIKSRLNTCGTDVNKKARAWLKSAGKLADNLDTFDAFTFWDVLEHVDVPNIYFKHMRPGSLLFTSLPIFDDLKKVRQSKHYRPNEHFYYWTERGFVDWMALYRFRLLEVSDCETEAGRESIKSFAFKRDLPGYGDTLQQYKIIHSACYGASAYLYFEQIAREVFNFGPQSIIDYGCGRSDLVAHFWADGRRRIAKYDPAIPNYADMPEGEFDLVLCTDVMEHIPMSDVDRVFAEIKAKSKSALFTISTIPARAKLPDGRNAHITILSPDEWAAWIKSTFGTAICIPTKWEHILMVKTFG